MILRRLLVALTLVTLGGTVPARAQDMATVLPNNYVLSDILNKQRVDAAIGFGRSARPAQRPAAAPALTVYRASPQVSARVRTQFVDWMGKQAGPDGGRRIAEALAQRDPVQNWAQIVGGDGLRPGDTADALASYWILNWVMANGGDNNRAQAQAVRAQVRSMIAANPAYARLTEIQRQEMSETLMLNFLIQHAAYTDALKRGDRAAARRLGDAAITRFRNEMGVDLRRLSLTDAGFIQNG